MKHSRWTQAEAQINALLAAEPNNLDALFLAGQIAEQRQQPKQAAAYYRQMLEHNSNLPRPRLELAKSLWQSGDAEAAEYHFRLAQSLALPEAVQKNVERYLQAIKRERLTWQVSATLAPGSNINQGSRHETVEINGETFTLSPDNRAKSGIGLNIQAGGRYRFGHQHRWFAEGMAAWQEHSGRHNDSLYTRALLGRTLSPHGSRRHLQAAVGIQHVQYRQRALYLGAIVKIDYAQPWGSNKQWFAGWESQQLHYRPEYRYMRAHQHWFNTGISGTAGGRTDYRTSLYGGINRAEEKAYSFDSIGTEASLRHNFNWQQLTLGAHIGYQHTRYRGEAAFFKQTRREQRYSGRLTALKRNWQWRGIAPELALQYSRTRSNIALYDSHSKQLNLTFSKTF